MKTDRATYRWAVGLALAAALIMVWISLAVGIIGSEDNPANLMYVGVLAVGFVGAIIARLRPRGMARAMFATAIAQTLVLVVAQALHWFDLDRFYAEVKRVLKPGGLLAVMTYNLLTIDGDDNTPLRHLHDITLDGYWTPERAHVDNGYADLPFPFARVDVPDFPMTKPWTLDQLLGYVGTWSGLEKYRKRTGNDPMPAFRTEMEHFWGDPDQPRLMIWPLTTMVGRCHVE